MIKFGNRIFKVLSYLKLYRAVPSSTLPNLEIKRENNHKQLIKQMWYCMASISKYFITRKVLVSTIQVSHFLMVNISLLVFSKNIILKAVFIFFHYALISSEHTQ